MRHFWCTPPPLWLRTTTGPSHTHDIHRCQTMSWRCQTMSWRCRIDVRRCPGDVASMSDDVLTMSYRCQTMSWRYRIDVRQCPGDIISMSDDILAMFYGRWTLLKESSWDINTISIDYLIPYLSASIGYTRRASTWNAITSACWLTFADVRTRSPLSSSSIISKPVSIGLKDLCSWPTRAPDAFRRGLYCAELGGGPSPKPPHRHADTSPYPSIDANNV